MGRSTTRGCPQHPIRAPVLDGLEVQVLEDDPGLPGDQRGTVARDQRAPVAEDAVSERSGRLVDEHEVDLPLGCRLEPSGQAAEGGMVARGAGTELDGDVDVAGWPERTAGAGAKQHRIRDVLLIFKGPAKPVEHAAIVVWHPAASRAAGARVPRPREPSPLGPPLNLMRRSAVRDQRSEAAIRPGQGSLRTAMMNSAAGVAIPTRS